MWVHNSETGRTLPILHRQVVGEVWPAMSAANGWWHRQIPGQTVHDAPLPLAKAKRELLAEFGLPKRRGEG